MEWKPWMLWAIGGVVLLFVLRGKGGGSGRAAFSQDVSSGASSAAGLQSQLAKAAGSRQAAMDSLEIDNAKFAAGIQKQAAGLQLERLAAVTRADSAKAGADTAYFNRVASLFGQGGPANGCVDGKAYFDVTTMSIQCRSKTSGLRKPAREVSQWAAPKLRKAADTYLSKQTGGLF